MPQVPRLVILPIIGDNFYWYICSTASSAITLEKRLRRDWSGTGSEWSVVMARIGNELCQKLRSFRVVYNTRMESTFKYATDLGYTGPRKQ